MAQAAWAWRVMSLRLCDEWIVLRALSGRADSHPEAARGLVPMGLDVERRFLSQERR
jgi:hypothetical protein